MTRSGAGWVVRAWLLSRGLLALLALLVMVRLGHGLLDVLGGWDVAHYARIAREGYADPLERAFFPGLPLLLRVGGLLGVPMPVVGVVVAGIGSALAAWALLRLGGPVAACLWLLAPTTVFTAVAYTEAPFCAAAFWAWERATRQRWGQAALLAALAGSFRVSGLFLVGALGILALTQRRSWRQRFGAASLVALALLVPAAYVVYLHQLSGSWTEWFSAQQAGWGRGFHTPAEALRATLAATDPARWPGRPEVAKVFMAEVGSMALGVVLTGVLLVLRRWAQAAWVGVQVLALGTSTWFISVNRAVLLWFPLWLLVAEVVAWGRRRDDLVGRAVLVLVGLGTLASTALMLWWAWTFHRGGWAS